MVKTGKTKYKKANTLPDVEETSVGVHAILVTHDNQIILQQREINPKIVNSGLISMFGGTIRKSDTLLEGLERELQEELELNIKEHLPISKLGTFYKTKEFDGVDYEINVYLLYNVNLNKLRLHEGKGFVIGGAEQLVDNPKLTRITSLAIREFIRKATKLT